MEFTAVDIGLLIIFLGLLLYYYGTYHFDYFKKRGIKNVTPVLPFLGNSLPFFQGLDVDKQIDGTYAKFPDEKYFGVFGLRRPFLWVTDPEVIKKIAIKDFDHFVDHSNSLSENTDPLFNNSLPNLKGQKWKEMRNTLTPAFTSSKMRNMFPFVEEICQQLLQHIESTIQEAASKNEKAEFNTEELFRRYANDVIASNAFGLKIDSFKDKDNEFYKMGTAMSVMSPKIILKMIGYFISPALMKFFNIGFMQEEMSNFFRKIVKDTMKMREEQNIHRPDMIHLLMEAKKGNLHHDDAEKEKTKIKTVWTDDELASQAFIFFLAGFETVASTLRFGCYQLAANDEIQETLRKEIDDLLVEDAPLTYEKLMKMPYMDQFISETLRMGAFALDRKCMKDYELPPSNDSSTTTCKIEKDLPITIPSRSIHRDPKHFPDPEKFDPDRFSESRKQQINMNVFLPFGIGPRSCIGNRFALMEMKAVFFYVLSKYKFVPTEKTVDPETAPKVFGSLNPKAGWWVGIEPR